MVTNRMRLHDIFPEIWDRHYSSGASNGPKVLSSTWKLTTGYYRAPAISTSPRSLFRMQKPGPHPAPPESEFMSSIPQDTHIHKVREALLYNPIILWGK